MAGQPAARRMAREWRARLGDPLALMPADEIVAAAIADAGLSVQAIPHGDPLLAGALAVLDREVDAVWYDASLSPSARRFSIAHELGHWALHDGPCECGEEEIDLDPVESPLPFGEAYVQGYSPAQRREVEANVFAAELLAPGPAMRKAFEDGLSPREIADRIGIAESTVLGQMAEAVLIADDDSPEPAAESASSLAQLDSSQRAAATISCGPALVVAGPGTGKTRTLIGRIEFLLQRGTPPQRILALTFSNRAAEEIRERLAQSDPVAARRIWVGTFHAFGLEILRRFGTRVGLPIAPRLLDPLDAIALMERRLPELELDEYEFLHEPTLPMRELLSAMSRAKDELKSPEDYAGLASRARTTAGSAAEEREARRAEEVARIYSRWQAILSKEGMLDFGDLLYRAVGLLQSCPDVRDQLRREYSQILVDEYQDINRASAVLVKELAGEGRGLWLVGDLRQAIYRFRGASPANIVAFEEDYPGGRRLALDINYRSRPALVRLFASTAAAIGQPALSGWSAARDGEENTPVLAEAEDEAAQADGIAERIAAFRSQGYGYGDQAILCRTNRQAEVLGGMLEERGIPVVHLGELLARSEVKDLLALLSLVFEGPATLRRVAGFADYAIPGDQVRRIGEDSAGVLRALLASAHEGARRLHEHLAPLAYVGDAHAFLSRYLFGPANYLRSIAAEDTPAAGQKRLAIHQLLALARDFRLPEGSEEHPQRAFLAHVRRLIATGEDSRVSMPAGFSKVDGVRLMTVHAAKGLEFPIVYIPNLSEGMFPPRARGSMVKLPMGLADAEASEMQEEERLFFVALSRARDRLILSYPASRNGRQLKSSRLFEIVRTSIEESGGPERWHAAGERHTSEEHDREMESLEAPLPLSRVETYMRCPRQYFYRYTEDLAGPEDESGYRRVAASVRELVKWYRDEQAKGRAPGAEDVSRHAEELWQASELGDHAHAPLLQQRLQEAASGVLGLDTKEAEPWAVALEHGSVLVRPDGIVQDEKGVRLEKHRLGRETDGHRVAPALSLYRLAASQRGATNVTVVNRYLQTGDAVEAPANARYEPGRVEKYNRALKGIRSCLFDPDPAEQNECNRCPFFLVCPR